MIVSILLFFCPVFLCCGSNDIDVAQGCELASYPGEVLVEGIALR